MRKPKDRFVIDFFEFSFLVEACIPPRPIARSYFWSRVIDHYHDILTPDERVRLYSWVSRNPTFNTKNEDCALFSSRYDPSNQYEVETDFMGTIKKTHCFKHNGKYCVNSTTSILNECITKITKL